MTTSEIAKKLGISRGTVSRVLNNHPNVKPETRQKVLDALKELNYTPNETARSLVMKKEFHIAVIVFSQPSFSGHRSRTESVLHKMTSPPRVSS